MGVQSVKSWAAEGNMEADDLFISGNADEVPHFGSFFLVVCLLSGHIFRHNLHIYGCHCGC